MRGIEVRRCSAAVDLVTGQFRVFLYESGGEGWGAYEFGSGLPVAWSVQLDTVSIVQSF